MPASSAARTRNKWLTRLVWLVVIWAGSVGALGLAAWLMRMAMQAGGLTA
ncbi:MAG: DUF2474 domain-containing protein [Rubrivivax sp.]|nr:DUF2474 domain-containing protein [Rubrivivax sp.]